MPPVKVVEKSSKSVSRRVSFTAQRGTVLVDEYPELQELVDWLTSPIPSADLTPSETLEGAIALSGAVQR